MSNAERHLDPQGPLGPFCANDELERIEYIICKIEQQDFDKWVLDQAVIALKNYEALLKYPLFELIPPGFYHISRPQKSIQGIL